MPYNPPTPNLLYPVANALTSSKPFIIHFDTRNPATTDINYPQQQLWYNTSNSTLWILGGFYKSSEVTTATWTEIEIYSKIEFLCNTGTATTSGNQLD
jgi:hypothetical protein